MKKLICAAAFAAAALLCGCDKGGAPEPEQWPSLSDGISASASYLGDYYGTGSGVFTVTLMDEGLVFDDGLQSYIGPGESLSLSLGTPLVGDMSSLKLPAGEYSASGDESHPEGTFCTAGMDRTTLNVYDESGNITVKPVLGGTVVVRESAGMYWISCGLELEDGAYSKEYVGRIRVGNMSSEGFISNLTGNISCPAMGYAEVTYDYGDGAVDNWTLFLANGYSDYDGSFDEGFLIRINTEVSESVPAGYYTVSPFADADAQTAGTITPGNGPFENAAGTWFFSYLRGSQYAQIKSGGLTVSYADDGAARISLTLYDGNGHSVTSSFTGKIIYAN